MGSFNVACTISNISIGPGTETMFIPLLPNVYSFGVSFREQEKIKRLKTLQVDHYVERSSNLIYPYCYYWPFSLPIKGIYNDYGNLEKIEENANTKSIEALFGINIQAFMDIITGSTDADTQFSIIKFKYNSDAYVTPNILKKIGLVKEKRHYYLPKFPNIKIILSRPNLKEKDHKWGSYNFKIIDSSLKKTIYTSANNDNSAWNNLINEYKKLTLYLLNVHEEHQLKVQLLQNISGMFVHSKIYDTLANNMPKDDFDNPESVADTYVVEKQLLTLGFYKVTDQWVIDSHHSDLYRKEGFEYDIKIGSYGGNIVPTADKEYAKLGDKRFVKETKQIWEECTGTKVEDTFPEPSKKTSPYTSATDKEWQDICDKFEELTGVKPGYSKNSIAFYRLKEFKEKWENLTSDILDISEYEQTNKSDNEYNIVRKLIIEYEEKKKLPSTFDTCVYPSIEKQRENYETIKSLSSIICESDKYKKFEPKPEGEKYQVEVKPSNYFDNPFGYFAQDKSKFLSFYKDWEYFKDLYYQPILNNQLKKEFREYKSFYWGMYSTNNFFFPAMNGEQCGNHKSSYVLYKASLEIIEDKLKEYEE